MQLFTAELIHIYIHIQDKSDIIVLLKCDSILQKGDKLKENMFHGSNCKMQFNFKKFKHFIQNPSTFQTLKTPLLFNSSTFRNLQHPYDPCIIQVERKYFLCC